MPETIGNETPVSPAARKRSERTEAKFFEDVDKLIAEAESADTAYQPPNPNASAANLKAKRDASIAVRAAKKAKDVAEETMRNDRENLYKQLDKDLTSLVAYAKSAGKAANEIAALQSIARDIKGERAKSIDPNDGGNHVSVSNLSYVTRADNYGQFIEQYDGLPSRPTKISIKPPRTAPNTLHSDKQHLPSSLPKQTPTPAANRSTNQHISTPTAF